MTQNRKFNLKYYFHTLTRILGTPKQFFSELPEETGWRQPLGFLMVSGLFFSIGTAVTYVCSSQFIKCGIYFINAVGMAFISAGIGYMLLVMLMGKRISFIKLFSIYAYSSGVTLLASWIPFFLWITEPWKWWLIGIGLIKDCGFKVGQSLLIISLSICIMVLFFWSLLPLII